MSSLRSELPGHEGRVPVPIVHRVTIADAIVIVGALTFAGFLCLQGVEPQTALVTTVVAVGALMLVLTGARATAEIVGLLRELAQWVRGNR